MATRNRQKGLTLVELIIGLAVGLLVISGAISIYVSSIRASNDTLRGSKLNQEITALLSVITNDVRRAGYWTNIAATDFDENPFSQPNATLLNVIDDMASDNVQPPTGQGTCLVYAYDATYIPGNAPDVIDTTDLFGFRLNGTVVQMRQNGVVDATNCIGGTCNSCTNGTWIDVTDADLIEVTTLNFDLSRSQCLNASEPNSEDDDADGAIDEPDEFDCYSVIPAFGSAEPTIETREVVVTIVGRLANDHSTQMSASQSIRVRNDNVRVR